MGGIKTREQLLAALLAPEGFMGEAVPVARIERARRQVEVVEVACGAESEGRARVLRVRFHSASGYVPWEMPRRFCRFVHGPRRGQRVEFRDLRKGDVVTLHDPDGSLVDGAAMCVRNPELRADGSYAADFDVEPHRAHEERGDRARPLG